MLPDGVLITTGAIGPGLELGLRLRARPDPTILYGGSSSACGSGQDRPNVVVHPVAGGFDVAGGSESSVWRHIHLMPLMLLDRAEADSPEATPRPLRTPTDR